MMNKITSLLPGLNGMQLEREQKPYADVLRNGSENYIRCHFVLLSYSVTPFLLYVGVWYTGCTDIDTSQKGLSLKNL